MARSSEVAGHSIGSYVADAIPTLLAGLALLGPTLGLEGTTLPGTTPFGLGEAGSRSATMSLLTALVGVAFGLDRGRYHGSGRLGAGVALCAFAATYAGLQLL